MDRCPINYSLRLSLSHSGLIVVLIFYQVATPDELFFDFSGQSSCLVLHRRTIFEVVPLRKEAGSRHGSEHVLLFCQGIRIQREAVSVLLSPL